MIPTPRNRRFLEARAVLDRVVYRLIEERRAAGADAPEDFLTILLRAFDKSDDIDARQLRDEVMTMFIAGFETVASALAWAIWMLGSTRSGPRRCARKSRRCWAGRCRAWTTYPVSS